MTTHQNIHRADFLALLLSALLCLVSANSQAIAFCALRDPTHQIFDLYPSATGFRSLVSRVDESVKDGVESSLPFTLHNRELGKHTLYVALDGETPLGLVHVRSEASNWGLIEIVWSLDLNLQINDFRFQRCREAACEVLVEETFKSVLIGKSVEELRSLINESPQGVSPAVVLPVKPSEEALATAVIRSALKTITVTQLVWGAQVDAFS